MSSIATGVDVMCEGANFKLTVHHVGERICWTWLNNGKLRRVDVTPQQMQWILDNWMHPQRDNFLGGA